MAEKHAVYENPLCRRYASREMQEIFSDDRKFSTWRRLWVALAESERELGLNITVEQIAELRAHVDDIDYDVADAREREVRHDVMAHIYAYGKVCPDARAIIHLGATSCYVGDNTDVLLQREALLRIRTLLLRTIAALADFAEKYADLPTLAYTHFQAAQPTTVGKRATLWLQDMMLDLEHLEFVLGSMKLLGCRGELPRPVRRGRAEGPRAGGQDCGEAGLRVGLCRQRADLYAQGGLFPAFGAVRHRAECHEILRRHPPALAHEGVR